MKFAARTRKSMGSAPGEAPPSSFPTLTLRPALKCSGKSCRFQSWRHSKPLALQFLLPWAPDSHPSTSVLSVLFTSGFLVGFHWNKGFHWTWGQGRRISLDSMNLEFGRVLGKSSREKFEGLQTPCPLSVFRFKKGDFLVATSHIKSVKDF